MIGVDREPWGGNKIELTGTLVNGCNSGFFTLSQAQKHETHLPTIDYPPQTYAWFSGPDENAQRPRGDTGTPRQRAGAAWRLTVNAGRYSFSRARRLDGPHAYAAVFAFRCWVTGALFQVHARPNGASAARLGIVVSKRVIARAVVRNYCKRLAREVFRAEREGLAGVDLVVRPRAAVTPALSAAARAEICALLHRAQVLCRSRSEITRPR
jgi:ribonuclease P protein component